VVIGGGIAGSGVASMLARGGASVTVLQRTTTFPDRVRGEMRTPWGVAIADAVGPLVAAGAMFTTRWVFHDAGIS
jgi:2-polyprenyl-6-methoxyphenol hydroxylase-like FAD-dependent oxidoreductase